jgi:hypothetical protein
MRAFCILVAIPLLACSGGGTAPDGGGAEGGLDVNVPDGCRCLDAGPPPTITVLNANGTALASFHFDDTGDTAPFAVVSGNQTNLSGAIAIGADVQRNVYVATQLAILVFPPGASGNVAPARTIAGPSALATTDVFAGLAVAPDGTIYAASELSSGTSRNPKINVFAPNANGNVAPTRVVTGASTTMNAVLSMAMSTTQVAVADATQNILSFDPQATGDVAPLRTLKSGAGLAVGIALDSTDDLYVASWNFSTSAMMHWPAGAQGTAAATATISGATTKITAIGGVAVDWGGSTYVTNADPAGAAILVFAPGATGDVAPIREISGAATTLSGDASQAPMPIITY